MERTQYTPGIYVEIKPVGVNKNEPGRSITALVGAQHAYLIYRKPDGTTEVLRGGPVDAPIGSGTVFGHLGVETGKSLEDSADAYGPDEKPGSRPSRRLNIDPKKLDETWSRMSEHTKQIGEAKMSYTYKPDVLGDTNIERNSNSVIRSVLEREGIAIQDALPDRTEMNDLPGIRNNLRTDMEYASELRKLESRDMSPTQKRKALRDLRAQYGRDWEEFSDRAEQETEKTPRPPSEAKQELSPDLEYPDAGNFGSKDAVAFKSEAPETGMEEKSARLVEDLSKVDDPVADLLYKRPEDLTAEELKKIQYRAADEPDREQSNRFHDHAMGNFDHRFGTDPVQYDAVGRMIQPTERFPHPASPKPARGKDGKDLDGSVKDVAKAIAKESGGEPPAETTKAVQTGLNTLKDAALDRDIRRQPKHLAGSGQPKPAAPRPLFTSLKVDGDPGPKTRAALKTATAKLGGAKVREGAALGRFKQALTSQAPADADQLRDKTARAFGSLYRPAAASTAPSPAKRQETAEQTHLRKTQEKTQAKMRKKAREDYEARYPSAATRDAEKAFPKTSAAVSSQRPPTPARTSSSAVQLPNPAKGRKSDAVPLRSFGLKSEAVPMPRLDPTPPKSTPEGIGLQSTINNLGRKTDAGFKPIKEDGIIGPKTFDAFNSVWPKAGAENFTSALGSSLGFFD